MVHNSGGVGKVAVKASIKGAEQLALRRTLRKKSASPAWRRGRSRGYLTPIMACRGRKKKSKGPRGGMKTSEKSQKQQTRIREREF